MKRNQFLAKALTTAWLRPLWLGVGAVILGSSGVALGNNLWENPGFEDTTTGWTGADTFLGHPATNGPTANNAFFYTFISPYHVTESSIWVQDAARAPEGSRFLYLNHYNDPDTICTGQVFTVNNTGVGHSLVQGQQYELTWQFAAMDKDTPGGSSSLLATPRAEVSYFASGTNAFVVDELDLSLSDGGSSHFGNPMPSYTAQDYQALVWITATARFTAPSDQNNLTVWVSMTGDSTSGMAVDNVSLTAVPVPEPGALWLAGAALAGVGGRRRRR